MIFTDKFPGEVIIESSNVVIFRGTALELTKLIIDAHSIAEAIKTDIEFNHINENNESIDFDQYKQFSEKY
jgi:hypothetical protein